MIRITERAAEAVKKAIAAGNLAEETPLRVKVKAGGCSGFSYSLDFDTAPGEGDRVVEEHGVRLLIDPRSELYLAGTEIDYSGGLSGQFVFRNPNATGSCGCGKSFAA
jgi:iron-sulfur cluster assembly protein